MIATKMPNTSAKGGFGITASRDIFKLDSQSTIIAPADERRERLLIWGDSSRINRYRWACSAGSEAQVSEIAPSNDGL
jgi:hypothetical protein